MHLQSKKYKEQQRQSNTTNIKKDFASSVLAETGFDWNFNNGWNLTTTLNRVEKNNFGHQNYLKFNAIRIF